MGGETVGIIIIGIFSLVGVAVLGFGLRSLQQAKAAEHWPTVQGRITASDFVIDSDSESTTYRAAVSYDYSVLGRSLTGKRIAFGYAGSSGQSFHREIYEALPAGTSVAVRYDPNNPGRSVLSYGVNQSIYFLLIFGGIWMTFCIGFAALMLMMDKGGGSMISNMVIYDRPH